MTFILIYVDDILIISNNQKREKQIKEKLSQSFKIKDLGEAKYYLGFKIQQKGAKAYIYFREITCKRF